MKLLTAMSGFIIVLIVAIPLAQAKEKVWYCTMIDGAGFQYENGRTTATVFRSSGRYVVKQIGDRLILSSDIMGPLRYECVNVHLRKITCTSLARFFALNLETGFALWLEEKGGWLFLDPSSTFSSFTSLNRLKCETF